MSTDVCRDFREWNRVLEQLERPTNGDERQYGLARLLAYRFNWRIRAKALQCISLLSAPEDRTLSLVLEIVADEYTEFKLRTLAADSLCGLISQRQKQGRWGGVLRETAIERLIAAINPYHPVDFQRTVKRVIDCAREQERFPAAFR
jgi:hypothetical protein